MATFYLKILTSLTMGPYSVQSDTLKVCSSAPPHFFVYYSSSLSLSIVSDYGLSFCCYYCGVGIILPSSPLIIHADCQPSSRSYKVSSSDNCVSTSSDAIVTAVCSSFEQSLSLFEVRLVVCGGSGSRKCKCCRLISSFNFD